MQLSWEILNQLEKDYGESFYILDIRKFENNYKDLLVSFKSIYSNTSLGYSYKTNYIPKLCQMVDAMGGYAEVVSQMEYDLAIRIGVHPSKIIFNGPLKSSQDIENAILSGSIVNLDSFQEVSMIEALAKKFPDRKISVGLRCNFDIGESSISRFGFDVEKGDIDDVIKNFEKLNNCCIEGLHCHFSTSQRSVNSYALRAKKIIETSDYYFSKKHPKFIDVGGGFFGKMDETLTKQFNFKIPNYQEYAEAIAPQFSNRFSHEAGPELIIEPGVAIVADVMSFVGKIVGIKEIRGRKIALIVGSIHNVKPTLNNKKLPLKVYRDDKNNKEKISGLIDIVGYTCMEHDCLYSGYSGELSIEDYVKFDNVGAYSIVFKPPFIRPNPPIISYDSILNEYELSRREETFQDVFSTYVM